MSESQKAFGNVLIVGLGMIGGSVAKALKERGLATLYGYDRRDAELTLGLATGVIDHAVELSPMVLASMDVIILATPVRAMASVLSELKPLIAPTTLITDVGSTKASVVDAAKTVFGCVPANFIPGHPIAGAEKSGVLAANSRLFEHHKVIITPLPHSDPLLLDRLYRLWSSIGAEVVSMDVEQHDHVLAASSHLPHLLAYTLVDALANSDRRQDIFRFAAGGFRDFTRIASSDPTMWRDVFLANKQATLATLDEFTARLAHMRQAIETEDGSSMFGVFTRAKSARDHFLRLLEERTMSTDVAETKPITLKVQPRGLVKGQISLLGDKSLSHRVITMAALANGVSLLDNLDLSANVRVTLQAFRDMGVVIEELSGRQLRIHGVGLRGLKAPIAPINVHNSSVSLHVLLPILAGQTFATTLIGSQELSLHPMKELIQIVDVLGVKLGTAIGSCLPVTIEPGRNVALMTVATELRVPGRSSRLWLSALLTSLYAHNVSDVVSISSGRSETEKLLALFGCPVVPIVDGVQFTQGKKLTSVDMALPADRIKTAWLMLLATILPGSKLELNNGHVGQVYLQALQSCGADISVSVVDNELLGGRRIAVQFSPLRAFTISAEQAFLMRDELVFVLVAALYATGKSRIEGINELPFACEDRLRALVDSLRHLGVNCVAGADCIEIDGQTPLAGELDSAGDYILALAQLAVGARSSGLIVVQDCQALFEEFEEFESIVTTFGLPIVTM